jgi:hypothetical protein
MTTSESLLFAPMNSLAYGKRLFLHAKYALIAYLFFIPAHSSRKRTPCHERCLINP